MSSVLWCISVVMLNQVWIANHGATKYRSSPCQPVKYVSGVRYAPPTTTTNHTDRRTSRRISFFGKYEGRKPDLAQ